MPIPPDILHNAKELRKRLTDAEALLWHLLRNRRFCGYKFRRQHPVSRYILDFYCLDEKLAIELDGGGHNEANQQEYDAERTKVLEGAGIRVLRFWNDDVLKNTEDVLKALFAALSTAPSSAPAGHLLPGGEGITARHCKSPSSVASRHLLPEGEGLILIPSPWSRRNRTQRSFFMNLDFSSLANAIGQLEKSISFAKSDMAQQNDDLFEQLRNSVIQCFEFTYELSWKMLKRYLEETSANPEEIDTSVFQNLIRMGNEHGLLRSDWLRWKTYRQARTNSSHTYDAGKAEKVYEIAPDFLEEARYLYNQLVKIDQKI